jgi:hypothetical protein
MSQRVTKSQLQHSANAVTWDLHDLGLLHPDAKIQAGGEYGYTVLEITGGPFYHSGSSDRLAAGTKSECMKVLHGIARTLELSRRSKETV